MAQPPINPKVLAALKAVAAAKRKPIVVTNPNDPRLKAYQDSANVNNLQKYEIANWNKLVKMTPAQRNAFYEKEHIANATDPDQLRYNQKTSKYNLKIPDKDLSMIGTTQFIDSPGIRQFKPKPFPAPEQPVVFQKPAPKPAVVQRTPVVVPAKIPIKLAPTNFVAPLPATPAPQPVAVAQPTQPPPPNKPDSLWAPGQRYSIKDEKVRRMLKAIQSLKRQ